VLDDPSPINYGNAGCVAMVRYGHGQWTSCGAEPELAGHLTVSEHVPVGRRGTYRLFVCPDHTRLLNDPQPMSAGDRAELEHRREQERLALAGKRYERVRPLRLARDDFN
jgi:hypothetical protein